MKDTVKYLKEIESLLRHESDFKDITLKLGKLNYEECNDILKYNPDKGWRRRPSGTFLKPVFTECDGEDAGIVEINNGYRIAYQSICGDGYYWMLKDILGCMNEHQF